MNITTKAGVLERVKRIPRPIPEIRLQTTLKRISIPKPKKLVLSLCGSRFAFHGRFSFSGFLF
jgi:hypothetical protein